jgi:GT2 family glycosyltransferase
MNLAVAIVGFRNPDDIERCLAALENSTYSKFEIIICENGGEKSLADLKSRLPAALSSGQSIRLIARPDNPGFAGGINACISVSADADAWWVLNPDTIPSPQAMARLVDRLSVGDCDAVGSTIRLQDGRVQSHGGFWHKWQARAESIGWGSLSRTAPSQQAIENRQNYLNGASMFVGRKFLETTGMMREDYFLYCEEIEWCLRGIARGMKLGFAPDAEIIHHQGTTVGGFVDVRSRRRLPVYFGERNRLLLTKDCFLYCLPSALFFSILLILRRYALLGAWRQFFFAIDGLWAGIIGKRNKPQWMIQG